MSQSQRGPREGCEDVYCSFKECGYDKQCMKDCIQENANHIKDCCLNQCPTDNNECIQACQKRNVVGKQRSLFNVNQTGFRIDWIVALLLVLALVMLV